MAVQDTVTSNIQLATTSVTSANLSNLLFATEHSYFQERVRGYSSITAVKEDTAIPTESVAYQGLLQAFKQPGVSAPVYLGRRAVDDTTLTPSPVQDNVTYGLTVTVTDDLTNTPVTTVVSISSGGSATATSIATALFTDMTVTAPIANITVVDNTGSITITADSGYQFSMVALIKLADTYTTTETAAQLLSNILDEEDEDWYWFTCSDHTETFVLAMADEIEATGSTNFPKQYRVSIGTADALDTLAQPATDILGKLKENGLLRTAGDWHDQADTIFPEVAAVGYNGQFDAGTTTWKFMNNMSLPDAKHPVTGKKLTDTQKSNLDDRLANVKYKERGTGFMHGGKNLADEWIDTVQIVDGINNDLEVAELNLLLNQPGSKIQLNTKGKEKIKNVAVGVLDTYRQRGALTGFSDVTVPDDIDFVDQANRVLRDIKWTGYLAGAVHFMIIDGILTYQDEELS